MGNSTGNRRNSTDEGMETYKSPTCLGAAGNWWQEHRGREEGAEDRERAMKRTEDSLEPGCEGSLDKLLFVTGKE